MVLSAVGIYGLLFAVMFIVTGLQIIRASFVTFRFSLSCLGQLLLDCFALGGGIAAGIASLLVIFYGLASMVVPS